MMQHFIQLFTIQMAILEKKLLYFYRGSCW